MKSKTKKQKKTVHRHRWDSDGDSCVNCGCYEAYCKGCECVGLFNGNGKLIDITS